MGSRRRPGSSGMLRRRCSSRTRLILAGSTPFLFVGAPCIHCKMTEEMSSNFPKSMHLGGGSWATAFHIGVVRALEERWEIHTGGKQGRLFNHLKISGDSAGAAIGAGWALGMSWKELRSLYSRLAARARTEGVWCGKMTMFHDDMLDTILSSDPNPVQTLEGRGFAMGITRFFGRYEAVKSWRNLRHLRQTFHASFHVPLYCAYQPALDGNYALDGGFSNNGPVVETYDITAGISNIFHIFMDPTLAECLYPPSNEKIDEKVMEGYRAAMAYDFGTPPVGKRKDQSTFIWVMLCFRAWAWTWNIITQYIFCGAFNSCCRNHGIKVG
jgi:hypothetical protein